MNEEQSGERFMEVLNNKDTIILVGLQGPVAYSAPTSCLYFLCAKMIFFIPVQLVIGMPVFFF